MKRWGTEAACLQCGNKAFHLHVKVEQLAGTAKGRCVRCGASLSLTAKGYGPQVNLQGWMGGAAQESTRVDVEQLPGAHLTVENHERATLTDEEQTMALRILSIALPEGVDL